ncbi:MAG: hypothetical protein LC126_28040 [Bryobacterales bacterium]|nr:hypothetical protein [Bryobacterales bacterium]
MARLRAAGFLLAQSNHTAIPGNGMWGNAAAQAAVLSLIGYVREKYQPRRIHAIAAPAGNVTLLNLALDRKVAFRSAMLMAADGSGDFARIDVCMSRRSGPGGGTGARVRLQAVSWLSGESEGPGFREGDGGRGRAGWMR